MSLTAVLIVLALLSTAIAFWQWLEARLFPLHHRYALRGEAPGLTLLKPLKGADDGTPACLRSWLTQDYRGPVQTLFAVGSPEDPVVPVVESLLREFASADARLVVCPQMLGPNSKVSKLAQLEPHARHEILVVSDADVLVPSDFLSHLVMPFHSSSTGLVNPFYRLENPSTVAMHWEAIAVNADFWSSVLQSRRLAPMRFALGAVMAVRRRCVEAMGGFKSLADCLADDYVLGSQVVAQGYQIEFCPLVAACMEPVQGWGSVWRHQLRWARTIRVCQPGPYFLSLVSNVGFWSVLLGLVSRQPGTILLAGACLAFRCVTAADNYRRLTGGRSLWPWIWLVPVKDLLQAVLWAGSFLGSRIVWRGQTFEVSARGRLTPLAP